MIRATWVSESGDLSRQTRAEITKTLDQSQQKLSANRAIRKTSTKRRIGEIAAGRMPAGSARQGAGTKPATTTTQKTQAGTKPATRRDQPP
jgi:hypothetical protein